MKVTLHFSSTTLIAVVGMFVAMLLLADIYARRAPAAPLAAQMPSSETVIAKEFRLVDDDGKTCARIAMNEYHAPCLQLFDRNGQQRAQLRLNRDGVPSLRLYDADGKVRSVDGFLHNIRLNTLKPGLALFDDSGVGHGVSQLSTDYDLSPVQDEDLMQGDPFSSDGDSPPPMMPQYRPSPDFPTFHAIIRSR
jgi:hypothetical protein